MASSLLRMNECIFKYKGRCIPYVYWSTQGRGRAKTIILLGTVQIENMPKWVAESCPPNTVVVQGAPHWFAEDDGSDIPEFMLTFTKCAIEVLLADYDIETMDVIAESQAVPATLRLFSQKKFGSYLNRLALVQPLGLNYPAFSGSRQKRLYVFSRRIAANAVHQANALLLDARLRHNHKIVSQMVGTNRRKAHSQYNSGLQYDSVPDLKRFYETNSRITVICGGRDSIFPSSEIIEVLAKNNIEVTVVVINGVPHSPLGTKYGKRLLDAALYSLTHQ